MTPREALIYLALKYSGDYHAIVKAIREREYDEMEDNLPPFHSHALTFVDEDYPEYLRNFMYAPLVLFYHGNISLLKNHDRNVAVIGTRDFSEYGETATKKIVREIDKEKIIVSGLASGIDSIAHTQALLDGGKTIAVLGSGINVCYPPENLELYERIKKHGLIISEYPDMTPPSPDKFPVRNRIIAFCAKTVVVTEAYPRSGTSITSRIAVEIGKDLCCVPYPYSSSSLCNRLISNGAFLVENGKDVLDICDGQVSQPIFEK